MLPVDGPVPREMVAAVPAIRADPLGYLERTAARYGDLVAFPMPRTPTLLVSTPSAAHRVLVANHRSYGKRTVQYGALALVTGAGLLTSDGETWRRSRRVAQPAFHHGGLDVVARESVAAAQRWRASWAAAGDGVADADAGALTATMSVVGRSLFGSGLHDGSDLDGGGDLVRAVLAALEVVVRRARVPLPAPSWLPTRGNRALAQANRALDDACAGLVATRRRAQSATGGPGEDLLGMLLAAVDSGQLSERQVRDELVTMVIAGHETVASTLTWTLHLLATHPEAQQRLHAELDAVLAGRTVTASDVPSLAWTRAVVDESLRLYPPAWVLSRRALVDDELDGVPVPAGTLVIISPWLLHRRAEAFADPQRFMPERFVDPQATASRRGSYLPFGAGPRLCIGRELALLESVLMIATVLTGHSVRPVAGHHVQVDALVTLRPRGGLPLELRPRAAQHAATAQGE